ncbi:MAG: TRAP transporter substrate-binding protein [Bacillaceae bacterium]|nr:TRAP transporter substrate-binding protein [Bacillaceae bacterium]
MKRFNKTTLVMFITIIFLIMAACSSNESSGNNDTGEGNSNGNSSNGETYTITMAHVASEAIGLHQAFLKFKEEVEEQSEGRLKVEIYPNAQLGGEREILEGVQNGDITATITSTGVGANFVPEVAVFDIPYLFTSKEHARHVFRTDGPLFEKIAPYYEEKGFKLMSFTDQGFRILSTNGVQVTSVEDVKGLRIRTLENSNHIEAWRALGANPTPIPFNEVYTSLQQGTVDAQENPYELTVLMKFHEAQEHVTNIKSIFQSLQAVINKDFYDSLPDDLRALVDEGFASAVQFGTDFLDEKDAEYIQVLKDTGLTVNEISDDELEKFREKTSPVIETIRGQVGDELVDLMISEAENY